LFTLSCESFGHNKTVEIYNSLGSLIKQLEINSENTAIDISGESGGIYFVQVIGEHKTIQVSKIMKQ